RQTAADEKPGSRGTHIRVVSRSDGDCQIQIAILENDGTVAVPVLHHIGDALAQNFGNEETAVEQNRIGADVSGAFEKGRQVPRYRGIGDQGESHFAIGAGRVLLRLVGKL